MCQPSENTDLTGFGVFIYLCIVVILIVDKKRDTFTVQHIILYICLHSITS
jgi:hypothetical protein